MNFGMALSLLKVGNRLARQGWNGKGMFIYLVGPGRYAPTSRPGHIIAESQADGLVPYDPYLAMKTVDGTVVPWLASQTDILADDWVLAEDANSFIDAIDPREDAATAAAADINHDEEGDGQEDAELEDIVIIWHMGHPFPAPEMFGNGAQPLAQIPAGMINERQLEILRRLGLI